MICNFCLWVSLSTLNALIFRLTAWLYLQEEGYFKLFLRINIRRKESSNRISLAQSLLHSLILADMTRRNKENQYLFVFAAGCSGISSLSPESVFCDITGNIHPCLLELPSDRSSATDSNL